MSKVGVRREANNSDNIPCSISKSGDPALLMALERVEPSQRIDVAFPARGLAASQRWIDLLQCSSFREARLSTSLV